MKKIVEVTVDIKIARMMLQVAGYEKLDDKSDEEIFDLALSMCNEYGVAVNNVN